MAVLSNPKHEAVALGLVKGMSQIEAYTAAGYKPNDGHAARLAGNGRIQARVKELKEAIAEKVVTDVSFEAISLFTRMEQDIQDAKADKCHGPASALRIAMMGPSVTSITRLSRMSMCIARR